MGHGKKSKGCRGNQKEQERCTVGAESSAVRGRVDVSRHTGQIYFTTAIDATYGFIRCSRYCVSCVLLW